MGNEWIYLLKLLQLISDHSILQFDTFSRVRGCVIYTFFHYFYLTTFTFTLSFCITFHSLWVVLPPQYRLTKLFVSSFWRWRSNLEVFVTHVEHEQDYGYIDDIIGIILTKQRSNIGFLFLITIKCNSKFILYLFEAPILLSQCVLAQ